ncbi:MAG TPA: SEC-C metal-binding domain-containing protein [Vicinamibacterales bacterium]
MARKSASPPAAAPKRKAAGKPASQSKAAPAAEVTTPAALPPHPRPGRNDPCHCGSGRKYKHCCLEKDDRLVAAARAKAAEEASARAPETTDVAPPKRTPRAPTREPWRAPVARGFVPRTRTPRKVGGS